MLVVAYAGRSSAVRHLHNGNPRSTFAVGGCAVTRITTVRAIANSGHVQPTGTCRRCAAALNQTVRKPTTPRRVSA